MDFYYLIVSSCLSPELQLNTGIELTITIKILVYELGGMVIMISVPGPGSADQWKHGEKKMKRKRRHIPRYGQRN